MPTGYNDPQLPLPLTRFAATCADLLKARGETVAVCESSAGGLIAAALVAIPGSSAYFVGGAVVYTPAARSLLLGFTEHDTADLRPASEAYALACARQLRKRFNCTWALAETGATGPTASTRLLPKTAYSSNGATLAYRPTSGGSPASSA